MFCWLVSRVSPLACRCEQNSLGRKHGFECDTGTLFFDVARIIMAKPAIFVRERQEPQKP